MNQTDLVIRGRRVVTENAMGPASVHLSQGRIVGIAAFEEVPSSGEIVEAGEDSIVMPGLVDTHVHVNEPGRTDWEGFESATKA
ncbi:MAG: allantoinase, partial [Verrucomicrobia bacterium]